MVKVKIIAEKEVIVPEPGGMNEEEIKNEAKAIGTFDINDIRAGEGPLRRIDERHVKELKIVEEEE